MSDTATPDTPPKAEKGTQATAYVVLQKDGDGWIRLDHGTPGIQAYSAEAAIRFAATREPHTEQEGTFVAIPARSWKPVTVTAKVETTLELKPAS